MLTGRSLKEIAFELRIARATLTTYATELYRKMDCTTRVEYMAQEIQRLRGLLTHGGIPDSM